MTVTDRIVIIKAEGIEAIHGTHHGIMSENSDESCQKREINCLILQCGQPT